MSFKPKTDKTIKFNKKAATTLDSKHSEIVAQFSKDELKILDYKRDIVRLKTELSSSCDLERILDIKDQIKDLKRQIRRLQTAKKSYFLENSKYIFEYFETKQNISNGATTFGESTTSKKSAIVKNFFVPHALKPEIINTACDTSIVQKYLSNVCDEFLDMNNYVFQTDICQSCYRGELIPMEEEGVLICNSCSTTMPYLTENEKVSYKEPPNEVCFYAYKRINHFKEILAQFQGKETTQIPADVIQNIKNQIRKERLTLDLLTYDKTKEILKKLGYSKYYEHIHFIKAKLGIPPPTMTPELEDTLCNLFIEVQAPYSKFCPDNRTNFIHYYNVMYKLCELLGETSYLPHFPTLKDPEKRMEQDMIWKNICKELDWEYIPSL